MDGFANHDHLHNLLPNLLPNHQLITMFLNFLHHHQHQCHNLPLPYLPTHYMIITSS
jgi:hypothetical protein